ncbi:RNB domain-containing ribonuclease [Nigerium massiliense]|uniref:RNB domain-containing ribonuclease n=1 Tax=Nigerium massiliense TaxID=1522317 RepID=UPI00058BA5F6|nr:RNB domain-containing ribonuclease [Nigerium massiliense]
MPARQVRVREAIPEELRAGVARLNDQLDVPADFPPEVLAEAEQAARNPALPEQDLTGIEFVTIDPEGSKDLDQALHIAAEGDGYRVRYAIADVAAFVRPGGAIDAECHARGVTLYAPHKRTPLHPPVLSEGAASLLAGQVRPAVVWDIALDKAGEVTGVSVSRARVRSREQLTYPGVQAALDDGSASPMLQLLRTVGQLREQVEIDRGGVSLPVPDQEVHATGDVWKLEFRASLPVEGWNAQISLLTGICAATMMLDAKVGIVRTLPPAKPGDIDRLHNVAKGLHIAWPAQMAYPDFVRSLDPADPAHAAMLNACTTLFRGAGYAAFNGTAPEQPLHAALATPYAHCTAPLRRLVDRYANEVCLAIASGQPVPAWVLDALDALPAEMAAADQRAKKYERGIIDLVEALVLTPYVGTTFTGTVIELDEKKGRGTMQLTDPAVQGPVSGPGMKLGEEQQSVLVKADLLEGTVQFEVRG